MDADPPRQRRTRWLVGSASVKKVRHFLIELRRGRGECRKPDVEVRLRMTVDECKHLLRGPDPRQSLVENLWKRNRNFAMVRWINTRGRPPYQERQTKASRPRKSGSPRIVNLDKASISVTDPLVCLRPFAIKIQRRGANCNPLRFVLQTNNVHLPMATSHSS